MHLHDRVQRRGGTFFTKVRWAKAAGAQEVGGVVPAHTCARVRAATWAPQRNVRPPTSPPPPPPACPPNRLLSRLHAAAVGERHDEEARHLREARARTPAFLRWRALYTTAASHTQHLLTSLDGQGIVAMLPGGLSTMTAAVSAPLAAVPAAGCTRGGLGGSPLCHHHPHATAMVASPPSWHCALAQGLRCCARNMYNSRGRALARSAASMHGHPESWSCQTH